MSLINDRNIKGGKASVKLQTNFGIRDYYKYYRQHKGSLLRDSYAQIIRECNNVVVEEVLENAEEFTLPGGIGRISFRKRKTRSKAVSGKVYTSALVDWKKTMLLWEDDLIARRNKITIKYNNMHTGRYSFRVAMFKRTFKNNEYFAFRFKRSFKRKFAKRVFTYNKPKIEMQISKQI